MLDFRSVERPYPGLRPFEPWEAAIFFGREEHTDRLQEILKGEHFLSVTGPSGCGKSSLVRAGLLPALPLGAVGTGSSWRFAIMRPGARPIFSLAQALLEPQAFGQELRHLPPGKSDFTEQAIEAELWRGSLGFISLVTDAKQHTDDKDCNLLLLVDQFEEIFTYAEAGARQADEADAFIDLLLHARNARESRIFVVLTMRTDFLGNCVRFLDLPEAINRSLYLTPRLTRDQLAHAIGGPALTFGGDLDPVLANELVNAVANDPDQLPVLQHALARMWDRAIATGQRAPTLRLGDLAEVGGVSKALSQHADEVLATLTPEQQLNAEWLFRAITDQRSAEAGGQMVRRPQSLQRIGVWSSRPWEAFIPVLKAFAALQVNFLTYPGQPDEPAQGANTVVDISHEALMRQWGTLKDWIVRESEAGQAYRDLLARARGEAENMRALLYGTDLENALKWSREGLQFGGTYTSASSVAKPTAAWATRFTESVREIADSEFALVADYIGRSHEAAMTVIRRDRRRRRVLTILTLLVFAAGLGLAVFGWKMYADGIVLNAQGLWHPLDFSSASRLDERRDERKLDGLMILARSPRSERQAFLDLSITRIDLSHRLAYGLPYVLNAAVGVDVELHDRLVQKIRSSPRSGDGVIPFVDRMLAQQWLGEKPDIDELFGAIEKTTDFDQLRALGQGLSTLAGKLDGAQTQTVVAKFLERIEKTTNSSQLGALGQGLSALAGKLDGTQTQAVVPKFLERIEKTTDSSQLGALGQGLSTLAGKLDGTQTQAVVPKFLERIEKTTDSSQLGALGQGLSTLAGKLDGTQTQAVLPKFLERIEKTTNSSQLGALGQGLSALAGKLDGTQTQAVVAKFLERIEKTTNSSELRALGQSLSALAGKLDGTQTQAVVAKFLERIEKTTNSSELRALGQSLSTLAGKLDGTQTQAVVPKFLERIEKTTNSSELRALGQSLSALAGKLDADQKVRTLDAIGVPMLGAESGVRGYILAESASAFLKGVRLNGQRASYWIEACRHPFVDRSEVARAIRLGNPGAASEEQGLWALLRWAVVEYKIDSRASLKSPVAENR